MTSAEARRRIGWLLRANRCAGPNDAWRSGREFARVFRRDGERELASSHVTRWEQGALTADHSVVARYEELVGIPSEALVCVCDAVLRFAAQQPLHRVLDPRRGDHRLHELLELAGSSDPMSGRDWGELSLAVQARPGLVLHPPTLWRNVAERLLTELTAAEWTAWLTRQEAACRLLEHPDAGPHMVAACIAMAEDPSIPAYIEPISLLDESRHPRANAYVLQQLDRPMNERALQGALLAASQKVHRGHFRDAAEWTRLGSIVTDLVTEAGRSGAVATLAMGLGRDLARYPPNSSGRALISGTAARAAAAYLGDTATPREVRRALCRRLAANARLAISDCAGTDEVLPQLVEEILFSDNMDEQLYATMLVTMTPYREPFAAALVREVTVDVLRRDDNLAAAVLRALTLLNTSGHRNLVQQILLSPGMSARTAYSAAWATPHCAGKQDELSWRQVLGVQFRRWQRSPSQVTAGILEGLAYGIGTDGHSALLAEIGRESLMPQRARTAAAWWLQAERPVREKR